MRRGVSLTDSPSSEATDAPGKVGGSCRSRELPGRVGRGTYPRQLSAVKLALLQCNNPYFARGVRRLRCCFDVGGASPSNQPAWPLSSLQHKELEHVRDLQGRHRCRHACRVHLDRGRRVPSPTRRPGHFKPLHGISLHVGSKHAVGYYQADAGVCELTLVVGEEPSRRSPGRDADPLPRLGQGRPARPLRHRRGQGAGVLLRSGRDRDVGRDHAADGLHACRALHAPIA